MKFLVFSDSHKSTNGIDRAIEKHKDITHIIFCGDVEEDREYLEMIYGRTHSVCAVCGNNDFFSSTPLKRIMKCEGYNIYITHGHKEKVKSTLSLLESVGKTNGADMCIFGHTHTQHYSNENGIIFLNPGAIGSLRKEYAIIDVTKEKIDVELCSL